MLERESDKLLSGYDTGKHTEYPAYSESYLKRKRGVKSAEGEIETILSQVLPPNVDDIIREIALESAFGQRGGIPLPEVLMWALRDEAGYSISTLAKWFNMSRRNVHRTLAKVREEVYQKVDNSWFGAYLESCSSELQHSITHSAPVPAPLRAAREWIEEQGFETMMLPEDGGRLRCKHPRLTDPETGEQIEVLMTKRQVLKLACEGNDFIEGRGA